MKLLQLARLVTKPTDAHFQSPEIKEIKKIRGILQQSFLERGGRDLSFQLSRLLSEDRQRIETAVSRFSSDVVKGLRYSGNKEIKSFFWLQNLTGKSFLASHSVESWNQRDQRVY
jgi:hypothetical protein